MAKPLVPIVENKNIPYSIKKYQTKRLNLYEKSSENILLF
ncbi:27256_t:CDS:2 [Dentiscutata erythropus]|uniref:27256_t:CDS:1 n=1 Tax=Dentiscutata erythropus TaxID=1348616 RepID=A0A9N9A4V3_9GLOM|nr:27256_t:CDS:2 [Dentiscutata erythropus]